MLVLDVVLRVSAASLFALVSGIVLAASCRATDDRRLGAYFSLVALGTIGFLASNTAFPITRLTGPAGEVLSLLSGSVAVFLWWFLLAVFDRSWHLRTHHALIGAVWIGLAATQRGWFGSYAANVPINWVSLLLGIALVLHLVVVLLLDRGGDLVPLRRNARGFLPVALIGLLLTDLLVDLVFGTQWRPAAFVAMQNSMLLAVALGFCALLLQVDLSRLAFPEPKPSTPTAKPVSPDERLAERLRAVMQDEKLYLDPDLTVAAFARKAAMSEQNTRRLINQVLGFGHFRSFLNSYRLEEAKRLLRDPSHAGLSVTEVAHASGFGSLASFNRLFKAAEGATPTGYRRASGALNGNDKGFEKATPGF
jgi:AraC-like DNA-binding protein